MSQRTTRARVLGKLLESLGTAKTGSRELDIVIAYVLGDTSSDAGRMIQLLVGEGYSWDIVSELLDEDLAAYTTSLDAAVPGEHIVLALYSPRRQRWAAVQGAKSEAPGAEALSWAATECLARRRAALRALYGQHARATENEPQGGASVGAPSASARAREAAASPAPPAARVAETAEGGDSAAEEWKILF